MDKTFAVKDTATLPAVYVATHAQSINQFDSYEVPIQTGAALSDAILSPIRDNTGDNISTQNRTFCELTALYWIWKNDHHAIKGLSHYRRRFITTAERIETALTSHDLILPPPYYFRDSLLNEYRKFHIFSDLERVTQIAESLTPDIHPILCRVMESNQLFPYNMWIAPEAIWNDYCEWLFQILFLAEKEIDLTGRTPYQQRVFGFLSERLFNVYIAYKKLTYDICPVRIPETQNILKCAKYTCGLHTNQLIFNWNKNIKKGIPNEKRS